MARRRFVNTTRRAGVAAAAWAARTGAFEARPPTLSQPSLPLPGTDVQGRELIIPIDNLERFKLKVMEFSPNASPIRSARAGEYANLSPFLRPKAWGMELGVGGEGVSKI
jgi:hypothetical protein